MDLDPDKLEISLLVDDDVSALEMEELTAAVRRELLQLDVAAVERVPGGSAPDGSRGIDLAAIGALVVSLGKATPVLGQVVDAIQAWASRAPNRTVKLTLEGDTLELGGMSQADQHLVIKDWMARHAKPSVDRMTAT